MPQPLKIGLIKASLPSYFPDRHNVWKRAEAALGALCDAQGAELFVVSDVPMDAGDTLRALAACEAEGVDFLLLLHGGFSMGDVARTVAASRFRAGFWSVPEPHRTDDIQLNNFVSLNMSMSIARLVRDLKTRPVQWYHGSPESNDLLTRLETTIRALKAAKALNGAKIGVIGGLAMTFYNMEVSTNNLRKHLGVEVLHEDMNVLTERMKVIEEDRVVGEVAKMSKAAVVDGVSDAQMRLTARCALSLRDIALDRNYDALAVSDWPALQANPGMHPGAAFSWLEETDGLPVASEGDVLGAITQLVAKSVTGKVGYLLDMTEPDLDAGQLLMWHGGGGPLYLEDDKGARWVNHPMIGRGTEAGPIFGAISDLVFQDGPVTVLRIARNASAFFQMKSVVSGRDPSGFTGCRGWLQDFEIDGQRASLEEVVATVMAHGLEHHFVLVPGDHSTALAEFSAWTGMEILDKRPMRNHLDLRDFS